MRRLVLLLLLGSLATSGCARPRFLQPAARRALPETLALAERDVQAGRYATADSLLVGFIRRHDGTAEAREAQFWRALYKLEPANRNASAREAVMALDTYLSGRDDLPFRSEARIIRRIAARLDSLERTSPQVARTGGERGSDASSEEVQRLRQELKSANEELERIKKRLAQPRP